MAGPQEQEHKRKAYGVTSFGGKKLVNMFYLFALKGEESVKKGF